MAIFNAKTGEEKFKGLVLKVRGTFRMDTSMDEVLIWNPETRTTHYEYLCGSDWWAKVDASEEVKKEYRQSIVDFSNKLASEDAEWNNQVLQKGSRVKVVKGRKIAKGLIFTVKSIYEGRFGQVLVLDNDQHISASNVDILYKGEFVVPKLYRKRDFYFDAV